MGGGGGGGGGEVQKCNSAENLPSLLFLSNMLWKNQLETEKDVNTEYLSKEQQLLHSILLEIILSPGRHTKLECLSKFSRT